MTQWFATIFYCRLILASLWDVPAGKLGKTLSRMASRQNGVRDQAFHSRKPQTTRSHTVIVYINGQSPMTSHGGASLSYQGRCDHHPWRQCSLYGLSLQLDNGGGSSHPCPLLQCLMRSNHTCHYPHRFNELATKSEKWNGKPRLECQWLTSTFKNSCTAHVYCLGQAGVKGNNRADRLVGKATTASSLSRKILNAEGLWAWAQRHRHHTISCTEEKGMERGSHRQSALEGWERVTTIKPFQRQHWGIFWEMEWRAYWLFNRHHLQLNWTEQYLQQLSYQCLKHNSVLITSIHMTHKLTQTVGS